MTGRWPDRVGATTFRTAFSQQVFIFFAFVYFFFFFFFFYSPVFFLLFSHERVFFTLKFSSSSSSSSSFTLYALSSFCVAPSFFSSSFSRVKREINLFIRFIVYTRQRQQQQQQQKRVYMYLYRLDIDRFGMSKEGKGRKGREVTALFPLLNSLWVDVGIMLCHVIVVLSESVGEPGSSSSIQSSPFFL